MKKNLNTNIVEPQCKFCKYIKEDGSCKKRRVELVPCCFFDGSLYQRFMDFYHNEWEWDWVLQTTDFIDKFGITRHLARHYLYEIMVRQEHWLFRVKVFNKAYYMKRTDEAMKGIENYRYTGIKIEK